MNADFWNVFGFSPLPVLACAALTLAWARWFGRTAKWVWFGGAVVLVLVALCSPVASLADGVLFSAHMVQHIALLLLVPALLLLSLPSGDAASELVKRGRTARAERPGSPTQATSNRIVSGVAGVADPGDRRERPRSREVDVAVRPPPKSLAALGWIGGVGSMWFWHVPELCDAAATHGGVHALQSVSLVGLGALFWWPILTPRRRARLMPTAAIAYLATACLACTALGIVLTLTPVEACPIFRAPLPAARAAWAGARAWLTAPQDRQIGGLLMWIPMCLVYLSAILLEIARWLKESPYAGTRATERIS